jgi:hypothetical protein
MTRWHRHPPIYQKSIHCFIWLIEVPFFFSSPTLPQILPKKSRVGGRRVPGTHTRERGVPKGGTLSVFTRLTSQLEMCKVKNKKNQIDLDNCTSAYTGDKGMRRRMAYQEVHLERTHALAEPIDPCGARAHTNYRNAHYNVSVQGISARGAAYQEVHLEQARTRLKSTSLDKKTTENRKTNDLAFERTHTMCVTSTRHRGAAYQEVPLSVRRRALTSLLILRSRGAQTNYHMYYVATKVCAGGAAYQEVHLERTRNTALDELVGSCGRTSALGCRQASGRPAQPQTALPVSWDCPITPPATIETALSYNSAHQAPRQKVLPAS